ncbi:MAG: endonuclease/exonuclease/phosphatase family protein [Rhodospirillales bacterium]
MQLHILTHNIHKGVAPYTGRRTLTRLREEIRASQADIVFLQEVRGAHEREPQGPQQDFLASAVWPDQAYGKNAVYRRGHHGNAILSKIPLLSHHNEDISLNRLERRGLLHAEARLPGARTLHLFCLHLNLRKADRAQQLGRVIDHMEAGVGPNDSAILAGDFNDWQGLLSDRLEQALGYREAGLVAQGRHAKTFPSLYPLLSLDRIYFRGLDLTAFKVLDGPRWRNLSDHLAMTATFKVP